MQVKRIYGGLNIEFEDGQCASFSVMDRVCDRCMLGGCDYCEDAGEPWNEYYQLMKYDFHGNTKAMYERDQTEALKYLTRMLQGYLEAKGEMESCTDTVR